MVFCSRLPNGPGKNEDTHFISTLSPTLSAFYRLPFFCFVFLTGSRNTEKVQGVAKVLTTVSSRPASSGVREMVVELAPFTIQRWAYFGLQPLGQMQMGKAAITLTFPNFSVCSLGQGKATHIPAGEGSRSTFSWEKPKPPI